MKLDAVDETAVLFLSWFNAWANVSTLDVKNVRDYVKSTAKARHSLHSTPDDIWSNHIR